MIGFNYLLFGYKTYTIPIESVKAAASIFLRSGIDVSFKDNSFSVISYRVRKVESLLSGKVEFSSSEMRGVYGFIYKHRHRYGAMIAAALVLFLFFFVAASAMYLPLISFSAVWMCSFI